MAKFRTGTAYPTLLALRRASMARLMPTTSCFAFNSGPPELPELMGELCCR